MLYESIGSQHDEESDHTLEQADGAALREVEAVHHGAVNIGFDDVRGLEEHGVVADQVIEQAVVALQDSAAGEEEEDDDRGLQGRQGDIPDPLPGAGTVDLGGLHHGGIHAGDGREVNHGSVTGGFPQVDQDDDERPGAGVLVNLWHNPARVPDQVGDEAEGVIEQVINQQGNQNIRNEVGKEHDALGGFFVSLEGDLIQQDREGQLQDVADDDEGQVVENGIFQQEPELAGGEEELEVLQPDKGTGKNALVILEIGEGDIGAGHGQIGKHQEEDDCRQAHQDQGFVLHQRPAQGRLPVVDDLL